MTAPISYEPKTLGTISALYHNGTEEAIQDITDWVTPLLLEEGEVVVNWPAQVSIQNGNSSPVVKPGMYLYLDEDGFHAVEKAVFEMSYRVSDGV